MGTERMSRNWGQRVEEHRLALLCAYTEENGPKASSAACLPASLVEIEQNPEATEDLRWRSWPFGAPGDPKTGSASDKHPQNCGYQPLLRPT